VQVIPENWQEECHVPEDEIKDIVDKLITYPGQHGWTPPTYKRE
jgi:hypothetical protein